MLLLGGVTWSCVFVSLVECTSMSVSKLRVALPGPPKSPAQLKAIKTAQ